MLMDFVKKKKVKYTTIKRSVNWNANILKNYEQNFEQILTFRHFKNFKISYINYKNTYHIFSIHVLYH